MNIMILGPGAIGTLWATALKNAGHNVSLWSRSAQPTLSIQVDDAPVCEFDNNRLSSLRAADMVIITVKAWQVSTALSPLLSELDNDCILLFLHNGMGTTDEMQLQLASFPILLGTTTHAALKQEECVKHTGQGETNIGGVNARGKQCHFIADVLNHALPNTFWQDDILPALWQKLAINCVINPLTAIAQCNNGMLSQPEYQQIKQSLILEITEVMRSQSLSVSSSTLSEQIENVIQKTANNRSSMAVDIQKQRPSEIDYITGYLITQASQAGIPVPHNQALYDKIKQLELSENNS